MLGALRRRSPGGSPSIPGVPVGLWGDPFALDNLSDMARTRSWAYCSSDEFLCVFPALVGITPVPVPLLAHMEAAIGRLAATLEQKGDRSRAPIEGRALPFLSLKRWLAPPRMDNQQIPTSGGGDGHASVRRLAELIAALKTCRVPAFSAEAAAELAFWTGVHPVYVWQEALLSHELFSAIGWVGICQQGRDALLPAHIAEYFVDVIKPDSGGGCRVLEPLLASYLQPGDFAACIQNAAEERLSRRRDVVVARRSLYPSSAKVMH